MAGTTKIDPAPRRSWLAYKCFAFAFVFLLGGFPAEGRISGNEGVETATAHKHQQFQPQPTLHEDQSYTIYLPDGADNKPVVVTPMTMGYNYELHDGELFSKMDIIPNLGFDYAILKVGTMRNFYQDTGEPVSLSEAYVHHMDLNSLYHFSSGFITRQMDVDPLVSLPDGYAMYILDDQYPFFEVDIHVISHKNLAPINGSLELASKHCNECYYAPGKGDRCTPKMSGSISCCGHGKSCMQGELCSCATTANRSTTPTKYRIEVDFLVTRDLESFINPVKWGIDAPHCSGRLPAGNMCMNGGSAHHEVPQQPNEQPYFLAANSFLAPADGTILFGQGHLHTGAVNITLYQNGEIICTNIAEHGTNPDPSTNVGNEQNHLIGLSSCYDQIPTGGIRILRGDALLLEAYYHGGTEDARFSSELAAGEHLNVMSKLLLVVDFDPDKISGKKISGAVSNDFSQMKRLKGYH